LKMLDEAWDLFIDKTRADLMRSLVKPSPCIPKAWRSVGICKAGANCCGKFHLRRALACDSSGMHHRGFPPTAAGKPVVRRAEGRAL
jgi:hypothetical protein